MYKTLGKKVAEYPGIAKPESQKKDKHGFYGILVVAFKKEGEKVRRYKEVMKDASGNQGRREAFSIIKRIKPDYIAVMRCDGFNSPEIIMERGSKKMVDAFLAQGS